MSETSTTTPNDADTLALGGPAAAWARSGAMWLSGQPGGAPLVAPGDPAGLVERTLAQFTEATVLRTGAPAPLTGLDSHLLGERAAIAGLTRAGTVSPGGAFRTLPTVDGWLGLSLARPDDLDLVSALVEATVDEPWAAVASWARGITAHDAVNRAWLLGLPASAWPVGRATRPAVRITSGARRRVPEHPLVIDLTSLWAGPLCAHLLGLTGCQVVKVESSRRLDGARRGHLAFYDLLHASHDSVVLDFTDPAGQSQLAELLHRADLVLEASRPRALAALGVEAEAYVADGVSWLSITARGRDSDTVGFGDDVAVGAGLAVVDGADLLPLGDALADPLAGVASAAAAADALSSDHSRLIDVSMIDVVRDAVGPPPTAEVHRSGEAWWVETATDRHLVEPPKARRPGGHAAAPGAHNEKWLR